MEEIFITKIKINQVRNIKGFEIPLSANERKHLIITGKNGSGKTSVLEFIREKLVFHPLAKLGNIPQIKFNFAYKPSHNSVDLINQLYRQGKFLLVYFQAKRSSDFSISKAIEKISLKNNYGIGDNARKDFLKYIVNLKADKSFAKEDNDNETANKIDEWFDSFERNLQTLFDNPNLKFEFDRKNYDFHIFEEGKNPYNLNQLSDGYSAIIDIVTELIMRMETHKVKSYDVQGVVLIDEIETHLHVELQKKVLPFLTSFFPKIQFIVTTHSPFVLSSIKNAVICDLEKRIVTEDLSGYSYDTLIESYFDSDKYSDILKQKLERYEMLLEQNGTGDKDELFELKKYLNEIPKFVSDELAVKLQQIKLKEIAKKHK